MKKLITVSGLKMMQAGTNYAIPISKTVAHQAITTIKNGAGKVVVFEGFFDFLSFLVLFPDHHPFEWDFCILNSLAFLEKARPFLDQYESVHLFLDNDEAGQNCSSYAMKPNAKYIDESYLYKNYKDLNEWVMMMGKQSQPAFYKPSS